MAGAEWNWVIRSISFVEHKNPFKDNNAVSVGAIVV
jgi:hypothetical protein